MHLHLSERLLTQDNIDTSSMKRGTPYKDFMCIFVRTSPQPLFSVSETPIPQAAKFQAAIDCELNRCQSVVAADYIEDVRQGVKRSYQHCCRGTLW